MKVITEVQIRSNSVAGFLVQTDRFAIVSEFFLDVLHF